MNKKAIEMSMNVIMTAILAIIVLIVFMLIFSNINNPLVKTATECYEIGGECVDVAECEYPREANMKCEGERMVCCINPCLSEGGACVPICTGEDGVDCNNRCPLEMSRIFLTGCKDNEVCCKAK